MSELIRPVFDDSNYVNEIVKQREAAAAYLGEVSVALCHANAESIATINLIISLNTKLREHGVYELPRVGIEAAL